MMFSSEFFGANEECLGCCIFHEPVGRTSEVVRRQDLEVAPGEPAW